MRIIALSDLYYRNYRVEVFNSSKKRWDLRDTYNCIGRPKDKNIFLFLNGMEAEYTQKDGSQFYAGDGDLVYTPIGSEYQVRFYKTAGENSYTVGTNFAVLDEMGEPFIFSDLPLVFRGVNCGRLVQKANAASELLSKACFSEMKAAVYDLLTLLSKKQKRTANKHFQVIEKGIEYMEEDPNQSLSIAEVARLCNVSEIYFRRLFKEYSGESPVNYRIQRRLEKAKSYLLYDDMSVAEIAEQLGFLDTAYFCKQFKTHMGVTPLEFRKEHPWMEKDDKK